LDIVYEDEHLLVVNKQHGLVVHPGIGNRDGTLVNGLLWHFGYRDTIEANQETDDEDNPESVFKSDSLFNDSNPAPGLVHRLDKDTSGLLIVAKYANIHSALQKQFKDRTVSREYHTICWGDFNEDHFMIEGNITRDPRHRQKYAVSSVIGKPSKTEGWVVEDYGIATYLKLKLHTGRTHQIRVHLSHHGHPIIADSIYGGTTNIPNKHYPSVSSLSRDIFQVAQRQLLHAKKISFRHPVLKETIELEVEMSSDIEETLKILNNYVTSKA
jgi:23S rRNA pseudouridine1911/1915/1917 synthase